MEAFDLCSKNNNNKSNNNKSNNTIQVIDKRIECYSNIHATIKQHKNLPEYSAIRPTLKILSGICGSLITSAKRHLIFMKNCEKIDPEDLKEYVKECEKGDKKLIKAAAAVLKSAAIDVNIPLLTNFGNGEFKACVDEIIEMDENTATPETMTRCSTALEEHIEESKKREGLPKEAKEKLESASKKLSLFKKIMIGVAIVVAFPIIVAGIVIVGMAMSHKH